MRSRSNTSCVWSFPWDGNKFNSLHFSKKKGLHGRDTSLKYLCDGNVGTVSIKRSVSFSEVMCNAG